MVVLTVPSPSLICAKSASFSESKLDIKLASMSFADTDSVKYSVARYEKNTKCKNYR